MGSVLVVGLETWTFGPPSEKGSIIPGPRRELINVPQLIRHHPQGRWYRCLWAKTVDCLSRDHLAASWRALGRDHRPRTAPLELGCGIIAADGALVYADNAPMTLGGNRQSLADLRREGVTNLLRSIMEEKKSDRLERLSYYRFDGLWRPRVERFEEFLQLCQREQLKVVFVRTPLHPLGWQMLDEQLEHGRNVAELDSLLSRWQSDFPVVLGEVDASRVEYFSGDIDDFYDEMHCGPENSKRILSRLAVFLESR